MRNPLFVVVLLLLAGLAGAQSVMPMPAFTNTYTFTYTRGFYFQAPVDFTITALLVPDEAKNGTQNVAVYRRTAAPAALPGTTGGLVFFQGGQPSSLAIPCSISFKKSEFVCILGACGNANTLYNSYGNGPFLSNVMGKPTSLYRMGMQSNFVVSKGQAAIWGTASGSIGRVRVQVSTASLVGSGTPTPGGTISFALSAGGDAGLRYQLGSSFGNGPIPFGTRKLELSLDKMLELSTSGLAPGLFVGYAGSLDTAGKASAKIVIPNAPVLKGVRIYTAFVTLLLSSPQGVKSISNNFLFTIG